MLILPTTASKVPAAEAVGDNPLALSARNAFFANYYALPAISVPCGFDEHELPVGLQVVGRQGDDGAVLKVAQGYQDATEWQARHPLE